jgi:hypothetical protein
MCTFSFGMVILYAFLDRYAKAKYAITDNDEKSKHNITLKDITKFSLS